MSTPAPHPDHLKILVEGFRSGKEAPIRHLYESAAPGIIAKLRSRGCSLAEARDLLQEAMIVLMQQAMKPDFILTAPAAAYLRGVCHRLHLADLRKKNRRGEVSLDDYMTSTIKEATAGLEDQEFDTICLRLLDRCFMQLSETCQSLLTQLKRGRSPAEITKRMEMNSRNTFDRRKFACLKRWRDLIQQADPEDHCKRQLL